MPALQRCIEMPHAVPLISNPFRIQGTVFFLQDYGERAIIFLRVDTKNGMFVQSLDSWRKAFALHGEPGKIRVRKAMRVCVMLLDVQIAFIIKKTIEHKRCVPVSALMRQAEIRGIVICDKIVELQGEIIEGVAVTLVGVVPT